MAINFTNSGDKQRPIFLGDPNNNLLEIMQGEFRKVSPWQTLMPEIIIETSSSEKDIIGIDGEIYEQSDENMYEKKSRHQNSKSRSWTKE